MFSSERKPAADTANAAAADPKTADTEPGGTGAEQQNGTHRAGPEETVAGIRDVVNPLGGTSNCTYCAVATDHTLAGSPASVLDVPTGVKGMPISVVSDALGGPWKSVSGIDQIEEELAQAGDGARGLVYGGRPAGQVGHVWNVINRSGTIQYVDGQTGVVPNFSRYSYYNFLRTK